MKTIETTIIVSPDGSIQLPPRADLSSGEYRAVLVVEERSVAAHPGDRATTMLRAAGVIAEPTPEMQQLSAESTLTLEEARSILDRVGGKPLSQIIEELRKPKE